MGDDYIKADMYIHKSIGQDLVRNQNKIFKDLKDDKGGLVNINLANGISEQEAEYIIMDIKTELGDECLDDGLSAEEARQYFSDKGIKIDDASEELFARKGFMNIVNLIVDKKNSEASQATSGSETKTYSINQDKPGLQNDDKGNYINVQNWGATPLNGNESANDCLYNIIKNYYGVTDVDSNEWKEIANAIMDANPDIYGSNSGRSTLFNNERMNTIIAENDKIYLPNITTSSIVSKTYDGPAANEAESTSAGAAVEDADNAALKAATGTIDEKKAYADTLDSDIYDIEALKEYIDKRPEKSLAEIKVMVEHQGKFRKTDTNPKTGDGSSDALNSENNSKVNNYIETYNAASNDNFGKGTVTAAVLRDENLSIEDLINIADKINLSYAAKGRYPGIGNKSKFAEILNTKISGMDNENVKKFYNSYLTGSGESYMKSLRDLYSGDELKNTVRSYVGIIIDKIGEDKINALKDTAIPANVVCTGIMDIFTNWENGSLNSEQALALLYNQHGKVYGDEENNNINNVLTNIFNQLGLSNEYLEKYEKLLISIL